MNQKTDEIKLKGSITEVGKDFQLLDYIVKNHNISKQKLKKIIDNGGFWIHEHGSKRRRLRRIKHVVKSPSLKFEVHFDPNIKFPSSDEIKCLHKQNEYSVWFKPSNVLSQGNTFGDKNSMLRFVEKETQKESFLIHRLDKETAGVMMFAHSKKAAAYYSQNWKTNVEKYYMCLVKGNISNYNNNKEFIIDSPLDEKDAQSLINVLEVNVAHSIVEVKLKTGRHHQIRRHLNSIDFPVIGDPRYGRGNKNKAGLMLVASRLVFPDIRSGKLRDFKVDKDFLPKLPLS